MLKIYFQHFFMHCSFLFLYERLQILLSFLIVSENTLKIDLQK